MSNEKTQQFLVNFGFAEYESVLRFFSSEIILHESSKGIENTLP
jgi:hypothetical protein